MRGNSRLGGSLCSPFFTPSLPPPLLPPPPGAKTPGAPKKSTPPLEDANARKARALIDKMIDALGGQAYLTFREKTQDGRYYTFHHGESNSAGAPFGLLSKYPDKDRLEILHLRNYHILWWTVGNVPIKDKNDIVVIYNGDKGYELT